MGTGHGPTPLGGELCYDGKRAVFTERFTEKVFDVAAGGDRDKLIEAYGKAAGDPGMPIFVTFEGSIQDRSQNEEGAGSSLVIDRFIYAWPLESNERNKADASLIGTYWRIVRMHDKEIAGERGFREPHILLRDVDGRLGYSATVGCNRMLGGIKLDRDAISFEPGATTLMACPPPLDDLERSLRNLLTDARRWCVLGNTLEFFDEEGSSIALLEATFL